MTTEREQVEALAADARGRRVIAEVILKSDWLAKHDTEVEAAARAEHGERIAQAIREERRAMSTSAFPAAWFSAMDRAERIARSTP